MARRPLPCGTPATCDDTAAGSVENGSSTSLVVTPRSAAMTPTAEDALAACRCRSTAWLEAAALFDEQPPPHLGGGGRIPTPQEDLSRVEQVLAARRALSPDQVEEIDMVRSVYSDVHLKVDRFGSLLLRSDVTLEIGKGVIKAILTVSIPPAYPAPGHPLGVRVTSRQGAKEFLSLMTKTLQDEVTELAQPTADDDGAAATAAAGIASRTTLMPLLGRAKELLCDMPPAQLANEYCTCVECNTRQLRLGAQKVPQPAMHNDAGECICLHCGHVAMPLPCMRPVPADDTDTVCCFCYVSDSFLVHLQCRCISCFDCFLRFSDLAIGSKRLKKLPFRKLDGSDVQKHDPTPTQTQLLRTLVGIPCPNHANDPTAIIVDPALIKLLPPRAYNRFNFFAMECMFGDLPGVVYCPLPKCCGYVFITDQPGSLVECPFCGDIFCVRCQQAADGDKCTCTRYADTKRISALGLAELFGAKAIFKQRYTAPQVDPGATAAAVHGIGGCADPAALLPVAPWVTVRVTMRDKQLPLRLPMTGLWFPSLLHFILRSDICPYACLHRAREEGLLLTVFHGALLDPDVPLVQQRVFNGAILFVVETFHADDYTLRKLGDAAHRLYYASKADVSHVIQRKKCPHCKKPVIHYIGHGCHMIFGCHVGMPEWCYVCGEVATNHKCARGCNLFCQYKIEKDYHGRPMVVPVGCDCTLCPDCKPMRPCDNCTLCPMCTMNGVTSLL